MQSFLPCSIVVGDLMNRPLCRLPDVIAAMVLTLLTFSILIPAVLNERRAARSVICTNNLKQLGLALHNYEASWRLLPMAYGGTTGNDDPTRCNQGRLSPVVALLPFMEGGELWEAIYSRYTNPLTGESFPSMGPAPTFDAIRYPPWSHAPDTLRCPADLRTPNGMKRRPEIRTSLAELGNIDIKTNYVFCFGDSTDRAGVRSEIDLRTGAKRFDETKRGMFVPGVSMSSQDCTDGASNTLLMSETRIKMPGYSNVTDTLTRIAKDVKGLSMNPSLCLNAGEDSGFEFWDRTRGDRWCDSTLVVSGFQTVLAPNSPSCTSPRGIDDAIASVSSHHPGGVHVLFADGRTMFISDEIDTGDLTQPGVSTEPNDTAAGSASPYGVWGALGSRAGEESDTKSDAIGASIGVSHEPQAPRYSWRDHAEKLRFDAEFVQIIDRESIELRTSEQVIYRVPLKFLDSESIYQGVRLDLMKKAK